MPSAMRPWLLLLVATLVSCKGSADGSATASVSAGREQDEAAVRAAFASYLEQGMAKKGEAVAGLVSQGTFTFHEQMRDAALSEPEAALRRRPLVEQATILRMRRDLPLDKLHEGSGRELLIHAIDSDGLADDANTHKITTVRFASDDEAFISMIVAGKSASDALRVVREGGQWKVDPNSLAQMGNQFIRNAIDGGEMTEKQALQMMVGEDDDAAMKRLFVPVASR